MPTTPDPRDPPQDERHFAALVARAQAGDRAAVEALFASVLPDLEQFLRTHSDARTLRRESQTDIAQSVCREALAGLHGFTYRGPNSFRNWIFQAAVNKVIDKHRYHSAKMRDPDHEVTGKLSDSTDASDPLPTLEPTPSEAAGKREDAARLERALTRLPEAYREIILQVHFHGIEHAEIAARTGRSVEASRALLCRAIAALSTALTTGDGDNG